MHVSTPRTPPGQASGHPSIATARAIGFDHPAVRRLDRLVSSHGRRPLATLDHRELESRRIAEAEARDAIARSV